MATLTCSLNITIPSTVIMVWLHNNNNVHSPEVIETANTRTLVIRNFQTSDAGVYQCVFNDVLGSGWTLRRNTEVKGKFIHVRSNSHMHVHRSLMLCN